MPRISAISCSVCRQAVPLPMAMTLRLCSRDEARPASRGRPLSARRCRRRRSRREPGACRIRRAPPACSRSCNPGSIASTRLPGSGGCSSRFRKLRAKTSTACVSAFSVSSRRASRSRLGRINRASASRTQPVRKSLWACSGGTSSSMPSCSIAACIGFDLARAAPWPVRRD